MAACHALYPIGHGTLDQEGRTMVQDDHKWVDGTILELQNGSAYDHKLWLKDGELKVHGDMAFFLRTRTWVREQSKC
jgi:uncharacterized protein (DUF2147 family)